MSQSCPILFRSIDGTIARLNAFSVTVLLLSFAYFQETVLLVILGMDFLIRVYGNKNYSPVYHISKIIKNILKMETVMVDAGAKRVAAQLGIFFVFLLLLTNYFNLLIVSHIIIAVFLFCTGLEFFFSYCIGCKIYFLFQSFR